VPVLIDDSVRFALEADEASRKYNGQVLRVLIGRAMTETAVYPITEEQVRRLLTAKQTRLRVAAASSPLTTARCGTSASSITLCFARRSREEAARGGAIPRPPEQATAPPGILYAWTFVPTRERCGINQPPRKQP
jgi:hypothetical protein